MPSSTEGESTAASTTADQDRAEPAASEEVSSASAATAAPNAEEIENMAGAAVNLKMPRNILSKGILDWLFFHFLYSQRPLNRTCPFCSKTSGYAGNRISERCSKCTIMYTYT